ncbi:MAG: hypothetical protein WAL41_25780 [Mycobacterium sp.]
MAVKTLPGPVIPHHRARVGMAGSDLHVAQVNPGVEHGRDMRYLYWISQSAWQAPVSECKGREARKAKDGSEEKRPWSWLCHT